MFQRRIVKVVKPPKPESKELSARKTREALAENMRIAEAMIRHRQDILSKKEQLLKDAEAAVKKAASDLDHLKMAIRTAPADVALLKKRVVQMRKNLKDVYLAPKVARLQKLRAQIKALEAEIID